MSERCARNTALLGLDEAIVRYGPPAERWLPCEVSEETFRYWQTNLQRRSAEVVLLLKSKNGLYLVHTKSFYPRGVYRLISGGVKPGEDLLSAAHREAWEETGLQVSIARFLGLLHHRFAWKGQSLCFTSCLFLVTEESGTLGVQDPNEAISGLRQVPLAELLALADQLENLPPEWAEWGRFRAPAHRLAVEVLGEHHV
jgi:8-oxo-dGTP pyrophosphatase MutT (NUDIX family)